MLKQLSLYDAKKLLTIQGMDTVQELNGIRVLERITRETKEVITSSRQFSVKVYDIETLECAMAQYTELAVERLRKQNSECKAVQVYISTCNFYSDNPEEKYSNGAVVEFPRYTSYTPDIVNAAKIALSNIFRNGYGYKVVMITLLNLQPAQLQGYLWIDPKEDIKKKNLMETIDEISSTYGRCSIILGKSFVKDGWQMKREFLSPCSTTDINNIPMVW